MSVARLMHRKDAWRVSSNEWQTLVQVRPMYPWRFGEFDNVMDDALNIAMDYLIRTNQAVKFREVQTIAANAIEDAWRADVKSRMRLTNLAIRAVEHSEKQSRSG